MVVDFRQQHNLPVLTDSSQAWSSLAQICQQPAAFEYPRQELPAWFHFTGPLVDPASRAAVPFPWEALNGRPLIYASLGTIQNQQLEVFARIAEACSHLDAQLVIALGGGSSASGSDASAIHVQVLRPCAVLLLQSLPLASLLVWAMLVQDMFK